jgi:hypothetical protein
MVGIPMKRRASVLALLGVMCMAHNYSLYGDPLYSRSRPKDHMGPRSGFSGGNGSMGRMAAVTLQAESVKAALETTP